MAVLILAIAAYRSFQTNGPLRVVTATQIAASNEVAPRPGRISPPVSGPPPTVAAQPEGLVGETVRVNLFTLNMHPGLYAERSTAISGRLEAVFQDVLQRFDQSVGPLLGRPPSAIPHLEVRFNLSESCELYGETYDEARIVLVYTCNDIDPERAIDILAHEFVHQIAYENFGTRVGRSDLMLVEGLATFGAGPYWLGGYGSFRELVRDQRAAGVAYSLRESYVNRDAATVNAIYYQWASFVEFLLTDERYRPQFPALYVTGDTSIGSAAFAGVYGTSLEQLEQEWEAWLSRP